jgi:site-specific recombinase
MVDRQLQEATVVVLESIVRGHHIYKTIWTPRLGETLTVQHEQDNDHDRYAVSVVKSEAIVGHAPCHLAKNMWYFLLHGGHITCEVIRKRKKGNGLEVPCTYTFTGTEKLVGKLKELLTACTQECDRIVTVTATMADRSQEIEHTVW